MFTSNFSKRLFKYFRQPSLYEFDLDLHIDGEHFLFKDVNGYGRSRDEALIDAKANLLSTHMVLTVKKSNNRGKQVRFNEIHKIR